VDAWTAQFLGADAKKGSVADYLDEREAIHSAAPTVALAAPNVALLDDRTRDGVRTLRMRVTAPPKVNFVVTADAAAHVVGVETDGKRVSEELLNNNRELSAWTQERNAVAERAPTWYSGMEQEAWKRHCHRT
jgi:hypothetical protein